MHALPLKMWGKILKNKKEKRFLVLRNHVRRLIITVEHMFEFRNPPLQS